MFGMKEGGCHAAEFAEQHHPFTPRDASLGRCGREQGVEAFKPMGRKAKCHRPCVDVPTQDALGVRPSGIAFVHFGSRDDTATPGAWGVNEDTVDTVQKAPHDMGG
jgi:hypothetical protein